MKTSVETQNVIAGNHDRIVEALGPLRAAELFSTAGAVYLHPEPQLIFLMPDLQP